MVIAIPFDGILKQGTKSKKKRRDTGGKVENTTTTTALTPLPGAATQTTGGA
jgi:hypothetical protein